MKEMMMVIMMVIIEKIKYYIIIMYLENIKNYFEADIVKYDSNDDRNLINQTRDKFMKTSFIIFICILIFKIIHLLLQKYEFC